MKELVFVFCSVLTVIAWPVSKSESTEWELFKSLYNKKYNGESEEMFRFKIYMNNKKKIEKHQAKYEMGEVTYTQGINKFSDMLYNEVIDTFTGYKPMPLSFDNVIGDNFNKTTYIPPKNIVLPDEVNWIKKGAVTAVKDQGLCGSCWAFSSTGSLEGLHFLKTGKLVSLSEQNLVDCSWDTGNLGCDGGRMTYAFTYIKENKGIDTEKSYPYKGMDRLCSFNRETIGATVNGFVELPVGDEGALKSAVATIGPISVAIDVVPSFLQYKGGVYKSVTCFKSEYHLNHAVLVVGYGTDNKTNMDYWLVKNSWGENWGEDGFIRMFRGENECGIATSAVYPKV